MILSENLMFSNAQAITASTVSTNFIDLGEIQDPKHAVSGGRAGRVIGAADVKIFAQVVEKFATLTSLTVKVVSADSEDFTSPVATHFSAPVPVNDLVPGKTFNLHRLAENTRRFVRLFYIVTGSDATAGKITAGIVFANDSREV